MTGRPSKTFGTVWPAIPLPASTATVSGLIEEMSTSLRRCSAYPGSRSRRVTVPGTGAGAKDRSARSLISARPVWMPTGLAPARHSLMPLYRAGLWLAVIIAPGTPRSPLA